MTRLDPGALGGAISVRVVCGLSGELLCTAEVAGGDSVADLKGVVGRKEGTPVGHQRLLVAGKLLDDDAEALGDAVASAVRQAQPDEDLEDLVLDLVDVVLLRRGQEGMGSEWLQACEEHAAVEEEREEELVPLVSLDNLRLGSWVEVVRDPARVRRACCASGLDASLHGLAWEAAAGRRAQVCAVDPLDETVEAKVPGVGDLCLAVAALAPLPPEAEDPERRRREEQQLERLRRIEEQRRTEEEEELRQLQEREAEGQRQEEQARLGREAERWASQRLEDLRRELRDLERCEAAERRSRLRALQLELHPDKQTPERRAHVQPLFLLVQREWELMEASQKASRQQPPEAERPAQRGKEHRQEQGPRQRQQQDLGGAGGRWQKGADSHWHGQAAPPGKHAQREEGAKADPAPVPMQLELRVSIPGGGGVATLIAERSWIVYDVKEALEAKTQLAPNVQQLSLQGEELDDADMLSGFPNASAVRLMLVQKPPAPNSAFVEKVRRHWRMLQHAPPGPKADRTVVLAALRQCGLALQHAALQLRADRKLALFAVTRDWQALAFVDHGLRADPELLVAAVRQDWHALEFAGSEVCSDSGLFYVAVEQSWEALQYAAPVVRCDRELLAVAVQQSGLAMAYASVQLQADRSLGILAVRQDGRALQHLAPALRGDREVALTAVRQNGAALAFASEALRSERQFVLKAVWNNGTALRFVADELRAEQDIALAACGQVSSAWA